MEGRGENGKIWAMEACLRRTRIPSDERVPRENHAEGGGSDDDDNDDTDGSGGGSGAVHRRPLNIVFAQRIQLSRHV